GGGRTSGCRAGAVGHNRGDRAAAGSAGAQVGGPPGEAAAAHARAGRGGTPRPDGGQRPRGARGGAREAGSGRGRANERRGGELGHALERRVAPRSAAPRARCRSRSQVDHPHRRTGNSGAVGARIRRAAAGGSVIVVRRIGGWAVSLGAALVLSGYPWIRLSAQTDSVRAAALRIAQTRPDSGRAMMRRLLASLSPQDSLYPGALFTAARIAHDAVAAATNLQRVVVEYGRSVWADSALVLLTQLYFAQGDPADGAGGGAAAARLP